MRLLSERIDQRSSFPKPLEQLQNTGAMLFTTGFPAHIVDLNQLRFWHRYTCELECHVNEWVCATDRVLRRGLRQTAILHHCFVHDIERHYLISLAISKRVDMRSEQGGCGRRRASAKVMRFPSTSASICCDATTTCAPARAVFGVRHSRALHQTA